MKVIDPGHIYELETYDGGEPQIIVFMKREGPGYPGNVGHHGGTNSQELLRAEIFRVQYLDQQSPHSINKIIIDSCRRALAAFELRADEMVGRVSCDYSGAIELLTTCKTCGHISCGGNH